MTAAFYVVTPDLPARPFSAERAVLVGEWERLAAARRRYETRLASLSARQDLSVAARWRRALKEIEVLQRRLGETSDFLRELPLPPVESEASAILEARKAVAVVDTSLADYRSAALRGAQGGQ